MEGLESEEKMARYACFSSTFCKNSSNCASLREGSRVLGSSSAAAMVLIDIFFSSSLMNLACSLTRVKSTPSYLIHSSAVVLVGCLFSCCLLAILILLLRSLKLVMTFLLPTSPEFSPIVFRSLMERLLASVSVLSLLLTFDIQLPSF
jgi:hypothetical protein